MRRIPVGIAALLRWGLLSMSLGFSPVPGNALIGQAWAQTANLIILDPAVTLAPTATDYDNDYVEATGASGLRVNVRSSSPTGMALYVRCGDAAPQIRLADFLVRSPTPPGPGGTSLAGYQPVTATNQLLWSTGVQQNAMRRLYVDVRIRNLFGYGDALGPGITRYTNTLTFTVIVP